MYQTWSLTLHGAAHAGLGNDTAATTALTEARRLAVKIGNPRLEAMADHHLGLLARRQSDTTQAENRGAALHVT